MVKQIFHGDPVNPPRDEQNAHGDFDTTYIASDQMWHVQCGRCLKQERAFDALNALANLRPKPCLQNELLIF